MRPILAASCLECHSQDKRKGGLSLATYEDILEGGKDGAVVRPGNGASSLLIHRMTGEIEPQMPKDELALSDAETATIRRWIDEGARRTPTAPAAPAPWEAPMALTRPVVPDAIWPSWDAPVDRIVASYLARARSASPRPSAMRSSRAASTSTSGDCCRRPRRCSGSSPIARRTSAKRW